MNEILPGLFHWRVVWPNIWSLESYYLQTELGSVIIDPIECTGLAKIETDDDVLAVKCGPDRVEVGDVCLMVSDSFYMAAIERGQFVSAEFL